MALWKPPTSVSSKEIVGRRAFTTKLKLPNGQFKPEVFLDERVQTGLSVDRLGINVANDAVRSFLLPKCVELGERRGRPFTGWAQFRVSDVQKLLTEQTPAEGEDNPYHAEVNRDKCTDKEHLYLVAFMLAVTASQHAFLEA